MSQSAGRPGITAELAGQAVGRRLAELPDDVVTLAQHCLTDWFGVAVAGTAEPVAALVADELAAAGGTPESTVAGRGERLPAVAAALANGTAAHALDYDDVTPVLTGHATAPVAAAVLALTEPAQASGAAVIEAFVAGYELACAVGHLAEPAQYDRGFHSTGTTGTLGAAAGAARLLGLSTHQTAAALGLAAVQAAGLRASFGTMAKPFTAGHAAASGVLAARLARRGLVAPADVLDHPDGFLAAHTGGPADARRVDPAEFHIRRNLFKHHAACYATHSAIEGLGRARAERGWSPAEVVAVVVHATARQGRICGIEVPRTGLEAKFSLRHTAAMALAGRDTAAADAYDASVRDPEVAALRERVAVVVDRPGHGYTTPVDVRLADGTVRRLEHDVSTPEPDLDRQGRALRDKARRLAGPVLGAGRAGTLVGAVAELVAAPAAAPVVALAGRPDGPPAPGAASVTCDA